LVELLQAFASGHGGGETAVSLTNTILGYGALGPFCPLPNLLVIFEEQTHLA